MVCDGSEWFARAEITFDHVAIEAHGNLTEQNLAEYHALTRQQQLTDGILELAQSDATP